MKTISLLMAILMFLSGCSTYRNSEYKISSTGEATITGPYDKILTEHELVGKRLEVQLREGTLVAGIVLNVTESSLIFGAEDSHGFLVDDAWSSSVSVNKDDIVSVRFRRADELKSLFAAAGLFAVAFVVVFVVYISTAEFP